MANVELVDREFGHIRIPVTRKIKFKQVSFTNISKRFHNFRLNRLKSKLISNKEKLVSMEFKESQLVPGSSRKKVEKKVLSKTAAIAKLESKINFLETGNYLTEEFVNSRAIKLKETMMKNLEYNSDNLYGVNENTKESIINGTEEAKTETANDSKGSQPATATPKTKEEEDIDKQMLEQQEQIAAAVQKIMAEDEAAKKAAVQSQVEQSNNTTGSDSEKQISQEDVSSAVNDEMNKIDVAPQINAEELAEAINEEMKKIKVSKSESTPAKVNKFINDDGTYRLKREDIDEDFRITRFDRSALPEGGLSITDGIQKPDVEPFAKSVKRPAPSMNTPRKAVTQMPEVRKYIIDPIVPPTIKNSFYEGLKAEPTPKRDETVIVPERVEQQQEPKKTKRKAESSSWNQGKLYKAIALRNELKLLEGEEVTETQNSQNTDQRYDETLEQFDDYIRTLEAQCNAKYENLQTMRKENSSREDEINAMVAIMAQGVQTPQVEKARHK